MTGVSFIRTRAEQCGYSETMPRIGPLVAYPPTPRGEDGRLLTGSFERLVDDAITAGADAVGVLGSTGGFAYMPRTARKRITRSAVEVADGRVPVIVGVGALSTAEVLANLTEAHSVGASGALLQPMAYQPLTFDEIYGLYKDASAATDIPLWVYNNPATTGHRFSVEQLTKIARLSAVAGFKDRAANANDAQDRMERIAGALPPRTARQLDWGFSGDGIGAQVLLAGATTWHSGLAGVLPEICVAIAQAATSGHAPHARVLQRQLTPLSIIVRQYGGIRTAHSIAQMLGLDAGTLPRPLAPLPADARALVRMALEAVSVPDAPTPSAQPAQTAAQTETPEAVEVVTPPATPPAADAVPAPDRADVVEAEAEGSADAGDSGDAAASTADHVSSATEATEATEDTEGTASATGDATPSGSPDEVPAASAAAAPLALAPEPAPEAAPASEPASAPAPEPEPEPEPEPAPAAEPAPAPARAPADEPTTAPPGTSESAPEPQPSPEPAAPVARRAAPARTRAAARATPSPVPSDAPAARTGASAPGTAPTASTARATSPRPPAATPAAVSSATAETPPTRAARRPEPTKTGAVTVTPEPGQASRPAPVRSDDAGPAAPQGAPASPGTPTSPGAPAALGAAVPPPKSLGRSRADQPRRVRTPPTPVTDDEVSPDESTSGRSGRHSG